jgi:hypothetical protein
MIYEYALEPEMVAKWGEKGKKHFQREFGLSQGRIVSRYPENWRELVWKSFSSEDQNEKYHLTELIFRLSEKQIKRKAFLWDNSKETWLENALNEHASHPFRAVLARNNKDNLPQVLDEDSLADDPCPGWDNPSDIPIQRTVEEMTSAVMCMLTLCRWIKFIDPHIDPTTYRYQMSMNSFLKILAGKRLAGPLESIEIHYKTEKYSLRYLEDVYKKKNIIPKGLKVTLFQWDDKQSEHMLHNRYILTNIGGVSFNHGLDIGGGTDVVHRLSMKTYESIYNEYIPATSPFDLEEEPIEITGKY